MNEDPEVQLLALLQLADNIAPDAQEIPPEVKRAWEIIAGGKPQGQFSLDGTCDVECWCDWHPLRQVLLGTTSNQARTDKLEKALQAQDVDVLRVPERRLRSLFQVVGNRALASQPSGSWQHIHGLPHYMPAGAKLHGADLFLLGNDLLVTLGPHTNSGGFAWLRGVVGSECDSIWPAYLADGFEHGSQVFLPLDEGDCVACPAGFVDGLLPSPCTDWNVTRIKPEAAQRGVLGGLMLGPNTVLLPEGKFADGLARRGVNVATVDLDDWADAVVPLTRETPK